MQPEYEVIEVPLYSDLAPDSAEVVSTNARKDHLAAVLDILAGHPDRVSSTLHGEIDPEHKLRTATPDDIVVLYAASHGYADSQGTFYLVPYDSGKSWGLTEEVLNRCTSRFNDTQTCWTAREFLDRSISTNELSAWWQDVDAGWLVMILDSCHAGAVSGAQFRPGPLGDPGFGQLSYDKGMQILAATQSAQMASGDWLGGEGQTLLVEALDSAAQSNPTQGLTEWLKTVAQRLPANVKKRYLELGNQEIQLPEFMDFKSSHL